MVINFLLPHYGYQPSGGFKVAYTYANEFVRQGHTVNIVHAAYCTKGYHNLGALWGTWHERNTKTEWFPFAKGVNRIYTGSLREKNIPDADATIATAYETSKYLNKYSSRKGKKLYLIQDFEIWADSAEKVLRTWKYPMAKIVISKHLLKIGQDADVCDLFYIPNALDQKVYRVTADYIKRKPCIAMMYSSLERKGSSYGIEALTEVKNNLADIRVVLFGKEKRPPSLPAWMEYYENPQQDFIVKEIYNRASVFVCTSLYEGWGLPPMEAMACGAAVVTTDCGGVRDFAIADETAVVCPVKDTQAIKNGILRLLQDDAGRICLVTNALKKVREFDWEINSSKFLKIIEGANE